ncbi:MAG: saccharopine dehydrogenase [Legionellales bacterium]|nr:saccharopine dehydrogenase [Legionellales bacterium]|tara:strand:+ start:4524 stop:5612 length:1089 start_codon:yes stop_codon:yes gene_type:complete
MHKVLIIGAGKIGALITSLFLESGRYHVTLIDKDLTGPDASRLAVHDGLTRQQCDISDNDAFSAVIASANADAIISCLPYHCNIAVAKMARQHSLHYFDLTEDTAVTDAVKQLAEGHDKAFVPQCGLAPGFIAIVANSLMNKFDSCRSVKMRVGALPINSNNILQYCLNWSTEGLINEYNNPCHAIENGKDVLLQPLEGLESIQLDGTLYEAFNTSGGIGSLVELHKGKVERMNYKTIRYPGHCHKIRMLMKDLHLDKDTDTLKVILENALPKSYQDVVIIYVSVTGMREDTLVEENYLQKIYPSNIGGHPWSAIQITTASGITTVVDMVLSEPDKYHGFVYQENIPLADFLQNPFGKYYCE